MKNKEHLKLLVKMNKLVVDDFILLFAALPIKNEDKE